jgi:outer membrane receptor protein involved in Fe transport
MPKIGTSGATFEKILLLLSSAIVPAMPAYAQDTPAPPLAGRDATANAGVQSDPGTMGTDDDIVVTARQRGETLISVPVAVTAVSGESLARIGSTDVRDISRFAPTLSLDRSVSANGGIIALRGVSTSANQAGFEQAVSLNVDGVQTGRARILSQGLFDIDQVEVLKGPQALFFGKNSPAGVVSIKSAGPTPQLAAYVRSSYEFVGDEAVVEGAISGQVTDSLGARLAVRYRNLDGWLRNTAGQFTPATFPFPNQPLPTLGVRRPGEKELIGRLTLAFAPAGSNFNATLKLSASDLKSDGPSAGFQAFSCGGLSALTTNNRPDPFGDCKLDNKYSNSALPDGVADKWPYAKQDPYLEAKVYLSSLTANYQLDDLTITSVTGYFGARSRSSDTFDATSFNQIGASERERYDAFSQELRLVSDFDGPLNLTLGAFYQDADLRFFNGSKIAALGPDPTPGPNQGKYHTWERPGYTFGKTYSGFGQLRWDITDHFELAGGARYTRETKNSALMHDYVHPPLNGATFAPVGRVFADRFRGSNWSPEATFTWRPTDKVTAYIGYKTGYKSGGYGLSSALTPASAPASAFAFGPETVKGFEGGLKAQLADRRLTVTSSIYSYEYSNLQVTAFNPATTSFTISNAASARVKGIELQANARPIQDLSIYGAMGYNHARYGDFVTTCYTGQNAALGCNVPVGASFAQSQAGKQLARAPDWVFSGGFDYDAALPGDLRLGFNGNARYSSSYNILDNLNPNGVQDKFWLLDGGIRIHREDSRWQIGLIGRNLTNKYYAVVGAEKPGSPSIAGQPGQVAATPNRGRQIQLELTFRY